MDKKKINYSDFITKVSSTQDTFVEFENCIFETDIILSINRIFTIAKPITFKTCEFSKIEFVSCVFQSTVYFHDCLFKQDVIITNCSFESKFYAIGLKANSIRTWNNNFLLGCDIIRYQCKSEAIFQFKRISNRVFISQERTNQPLVINKTDIQFEDINDAYITIEDINSKDFHLLFSGTPITSGVVVAGITANKFDINFLKNKPDTKITFDRINVKKIKFYALHNDGSLLIKSLHSGFTEEESSFNIQDSYLGNCELYHVDLSSFKKIQIYNCYLQNIVPVNVKWNFNKEAYKGIKPDYLKELFRQLKNICATNMDKVSELRFEKLEMHFYNKQLHWFKNFGDWFNLKTNRISNDYGQNWILPFFWLIGLSFILYEFTNYSYGCFECFNVGNYLSFLFPFHTLKDILCASDTPHNKWVIFWDNIQRIISSYLIFQFLRAFRKYVN